MKKIIFCISMCLFFYTSSFANLNEVVQEASGQGETQHQAISEALLIAVQAVNGARVSPRVDIEETVKMTEKNSNWTFDSKSSPIFNVQNKGEGSVNRFQVLSVTGSKGNYKAKVRAYVTKFQSAVNDAHLKRIAVMPFEFRQKNNNLIHSDSVNDFIDDLADSLGIYFSQSNALTVVDRYHIEAMSAENAFLRWDGASNELARIGQKVGADFLLVGRVNALDKSTDEMYGLHGDSPKVYLSWRVIEANTSKVVASGSFNRIVTDNTFENMLSNNLASRDVEIIAKNLGQEILSGLKLRPSNLSLPINNEFIPTYEMTPGSSDSPVNW